MWLVEGYREVLEEVVCWRKTPVLDVSNLVDDLHLLWLRHTSYIHSTD